MVYYNENVKTGWRTTSLGSHGGSPIPTTISDDSSYIFPETDIHVGFVGFLEIDPIDS